MITLPRRPFLFGGLRSPAIQAAPPVPERPLFELRVKAPAIAYVRFPGAPPGGYLVCDEVRFTPRPDPAK